MSEINGCVPLFASPDTLISTLDMIVTRDVRVMVVGDITSGDPASAARNKSVRDQAPVGRRRT